MGKRTAAAIAAGAVVAGLAGAVAITPASAATADNPITSRLGAIKGALSSLVTDGTLTQEQADKVAKRLDEALPERRPDGPGGWGHGRGMMMMRGLDTAAKALGMTTEELGTALRDGQSLADVANAQGLTVDELVQALVADAEDELATAVKDGRLTQDQADTIKASLQERITDRVNGVRPQWGGGRGFHGPSDMPPGSDDAPSSGGTTTTTALTFV